MGLFKKEDNESDSLVEVQCPKCKALVSADSVGEKVQKTTCPKCGKTFRGTALTWGERAKLEKAAQ